jgi:hypothetical protein
VTFWQFVERHPWWSILALVVVCGMLESVFGQRGDE